MGVVRSITMVIWVALGGRHTRFGVFVGALVVRYAHRFFSEADPESGPIFLGLLFVISVLFFKSGMAGAVPVGFNHLRVTLSGKSLEISEHGLSFYRTNDREPPAKSTLFSTNAHLVEQVRIMPGAHLLDKVRMAAEGGS